MKIRKGFTLIELLVVVAIIAILSAIGLATFQNARKKAIDARYKATVKGIQLAAEQAYNNAPNPIYQNSTTVGALMESGFPAGGYSYTVGVSPTRYCVMSPVLYDATAGNCDTCAGGDANIGSATTYFCAKNLQ